MCVKNLNVRIKQKKVQKAELICQQKKPEIYVVEITRQIVKNYADGKQKIKIWQTKNYIEKINEKFERINE